MLRTAFGFIGWGGACVLVGDETKKRECVRPGLGLGVGDGDSVGCRMDGGSRKGSVDCR
jgi:hypothetical protein